MVATYDFGSVYSPFPKCIKLYFVDVFQSIGGWAFSLIILFQGQAIYKIDKWFSCRKM